MTKHEADWIINLLLDIIEGRSYDVEELRSAIYSLEMIKDVD